MRVPHRRLAASLLLLASLAGAQSVTPTELVLDVDPGDVLPTLVTVCLPGQATVTQVDVYILADTTGSMGDVLAQAQADAALLAATLLGDPGVDIRVGIGNYKDFPYDPYAFLHQLSPTDDATAIEVAISGWSPGGGVDGSEGWLWALHRVATDPAIGFRRDAQRIVVMFGDAPAHDPVCAAINGAGVDVSEAGVIAELAAAGPLGTRFLGISLNGGFFHDGLDDDPLAHNFDYALACGAQQGRAGQSTRLAEASGGLHTTISDPAEITAAILEAIGAVLAPSVDVSLVAQGQIAPFVGSIVPPVHPDVQLPGDPGEQVCVEFLVTFEGGGCQENQHLFTGGLEARVDGQALGTVAVTLDQPACDDSQCILFLGIDQVALPIPSTIGPPDVLAVHPLVAWPVLLDDVPVLAIPNDPALLGVHVSLQCGMFNAFDFPDDPVKCTSGLDVTLGVDAVPYGPASGMQIWLAQTPLLGGALEPRFSIDGF